MAAARTAQPLDARAHPRLLAPVTRAPASSEGRSTVLKAHTGTVRSVSFSADGRLLATASDDKTVKLWSLPGQRFAATLAGHSNWVRAAAFSPDGRLVASAGDDRCVKVRGAWVGWGLGADACRCLHPVLALIWGVACGWACAHVAPMRDRCPPHATAGV